MIQFERIEIHEFRGLRNLTLDLGSKSFVIHGPNGSGKSGIVDAIDFALTGSIARLSGTGTGGVSVTKHGPHVHRRDDPAAAVVALTVRDPDTGDVAVLTRSIKSHDRYSLEPDSMPMRAAIQEAASHPELVLSRRDIVRFIITTPGDRASQIQALLKLDHLTAFRKTMRTVQSRAASNLKAAQAGREAAEGSFRAHAGVERLLKQPILDAVNLRRVVVGLRPLDDFTLATDPFVGGEAIDLGANQIDVRSATDEIGRLLADVREHVEIDNLRAVFSSAVAPLTDDPLIASDIRSADLVERGLAHLDSESCPLCDLQWDSLDALAEHLRQKQQRSAAAAKLRDTAAAAGAQYARGLSDLVARARRAANLASQLRHDSVAPALQSWADELLLLAQRVSPPGSFVWSSDGYGEHVPSPLVVRGVHELEVALRDLPDQSEQVAALTWLTSARDRWAAVRTTRSTAKKAASVQEGAAEAYELYCKAMDEVLVDLYEAVEHDFSRYYQAINSDNEAAFTASLIPAAGSLDLQVDFFGLGKFPPAAYHSEGHQDGMGICLYLALVRKLLGQEFSYAVFDDIVMSVDSNHRREFSRLLRTEFPEVQFVLTTHDELWARQMRAEGLAGPKAQARFYGWTVDDGPLFEQGEVWDRIDEDLAKGDVPAAAHKLRRRLEAASAEIAASIGGKVPYRPDGGYELGELMDAVVSRHADLLGKGAAAANSWNNGAAKSDVETKKAARVAVTGDQDAESWIVNPLVHNNDWASTATESDLRPVIDSAKAFLQLFECPNPDCTGWIRVVGSPPEELRCDCGGYLVNLKKK